MKVNNQPQRTIWTDPDDGSVRIIDQTELPHTFTTDSLKTVEDAADAIVTMKVRGAPLIGATAAYGIALAMEQGDSDDALDEARQLLLSTRPTAVNLRWALETMTDALASTPRGQRANAARQKAGAICEEDVSHCRAIGEHGLALLRNIWQQREAEHERLNILTHCNAGWLATIDWGTALAPVYAASDAGLPVHVWVDETRPRNQGARLTAWELGQHGVPHTIIVDNAGGHLMQHGQVDLCIVGSDRVTRTGDVCNKIGTYLKALAAQDNGVPFYVAFPSSTIDWRIEDGVASIPIEERDADEIHFISDDASQVRLTPRGSRAANFGFDVTPARLVTALMTERGVCPASPEGLRQLYPEK